MNEEGPIITRLRKLTQPAQDWGPADPADRAQWRATTRPHPKGVPTAHMLRTDTAISTIPMLQVRQVWHRPPRRPIPLLSALGIFSCCVFPYFLGSGFIGDEF